MAAISGYLGVGASIVDGVLAEPAGVPRAPLTGDIEGALLTIAAGVTLGPFVTTTGPFSAWAVFSATVGGVMLYSSTMPPIGVPVGSYLTFFADSYTVSPGGTPGADVVLAAGIPLTIGGQPVQIA